jgi:hypothetical protein
MKEKILIEVIFNCRINLLKRYVEYYAAPLPLPDIFEINSNQFQSPFGTGLLRLTQYKRNLAPLGITNILIRKL